MVAEHSFDISLESGIRLARLPPSNSVSQLSSGDEAPNPMNEATGVVQSEQHSPYETSDEVPVTFGRYPSSDSSETKLNDSTISNSKYALEKPSVLTTIGDFFQSLFSVVSRHLTTMQDRMYWKRIGQTEERFGFYDHLRAFIKNIGLSSIQNALFKFLNKELNEEPKVFMNRSKTVAAVRCSLHIFPIGAAMSLLVLNSMGLYIGGELSGISGQDVEKLAALTFAAKLHEMLMLASLGGVLITYIQKELAFGEGLPFGALFGALEFQDIRFLVSLEFWGAIYHEWQRRSTKWFMILLMVTCTVLGLTVGPSTSNLMKPRLGDWAAGGTEFWINCTESELYPRQLQTSDSLLHCAEDRGDLSCPSGNWEILSQNYYSFFPNLVDAGSVPQNITISSSTSARSFGMRTRNVFNPHKLLWGNAFTIATTPLSAVADSLAELGRLWSYAAANIDIGHFKYRNDAIFTVNSMQPVVLTHCRQSSYTAPDNITLYFPALGTVSLTWGPNTAPSSQATFDMYTGFSDKSVEDEIEKILLSGSAPSILWLDNTHLLQEINATLAAVFAIPGSAEKSPEYYTCSIDSRFANVTLRSLWSKAKIVYGEPVDFILNGTFHTDWPQVALSADWASYLIPKIPGTNDTILSPISSMAGIFNSTKQSEYYYFEIIVENIIATLIANGIGRSSYMYGIIMDLKDAIDPRSIWPGGGWIYEIIPKKGNMGRGGNAFNVSASVQKKSTGMTMNAYVNGYAYSPSGITTKLEMTVLAVYILVAIIHVVYSLYSGLSSESWGSASEIAALAWNSMPTNKMKNTGAGINTVSVFKNNIRVVDRGDRLEIMVKEDIGKIGDAATVMAERESGHMDGQGIQVPGPVEENKAYS